MKIYGKILLATLPLVLLAFLVAGGITYYLSRAALTEIAEQWLETRGSEALAVVQEQAEYLTSYGLDTIDASVRQAQTDAGAALAGIEVGNEGYVFAVTASGVIAQHPDSSMVGRNVSSAPWFAKMKASKNGQLHYRFEGKPHLANFQYFNIWKWFVLATAPESEVYGAVNRLGAYVLILGVIGSSLIAVVLMVLARRVTAPLQALVSGAERVGRGELATRISVETRDEVGVLARAFNEMTEQLQAFYGRLEERLTTVVSNAPIVLFSLDEQAKFTLLQGKGLKALNLESDEILGSPAAQVFAREPKILESIETALGGETVNTIAKLDDLIFEIWCSPMDAGSGVAEGVIGVAVDITQRNRAEERVRRQAKYLAALHETTLEIISRLELDDLLKALIARAGRLLDTSHGYIYLADENNQEIRRRVGLGIYEQSIGYRLNSGQGVAGRVWQSGAPLVINDYCNWDGRVPNAQYDGQIRALVGFPLMSGERIIGVIGMAFDTNSEKLIGDEEVDVLSRFAELASISLDNARLYSVANEARRRSDEANRQVMEKNRMLESLSNQLSKYLSPQVYSSIFSGKQNVEISSKRKKLTVFFSDISDFTETAERLESEDLTQLLNNYLTEMSKIALAFGATIDKYVGDAILIFFGDPETRGIKEDALACVKMAIEMRAKLLELQESWRSSGIEKPLRCRMGVNTGYCTVGNFGSEDRMDYTIIGGGVNLASRLETAAEPGEILISYETYAHVRSEIRCQSKGEIAIKGMAYPVTVYSVMDSYEDATEDTSLVWEDHPNLKITLDLKAMSDGEVKQATTLLRDLLRRLTTRDQGRHN
jgi:class 3 adenylate cyclase/HAMP domain-containing protein/putative methionine-R-sulfoxide reductase with GAF domain